MHVVLVPVGTAGDVLPFVALGRSLRQRGHEVVVLTSERFRHAAEGAGLNFIALGTEARYRAVFDEPALWDPRRAEQFLMEQLISVTPAMFHTLMEHVRSGESIVLCSPWALGALLAREKTGLRLATLVIEPRQLFSIHHPIVMPGMKRMDWLPIWLRRLLLTLVNRLQIERQVRRPLNEFRATVGLPPIETSMWAWTSEVARTIGLFPEWFASYQPDWTKQTRLTGFLQYCGEDVVETPRELTEFLDSGPPPVVFTVTSFNKHAAGYFSAAARGSQALGYRAVLLTPHEAQLPAKLPEGVIHFAYAPLSDVLPRSAALVHNGGIGALAQALSAGIPQLIVPFALAQPDHAVRVRDLRVGDYIPGEQFDEDTLKEKMVSILGSDELRDNAQRCAALMREHDALGETVRLVEELETL